VLFSDWIRKLKGGIRVKTLGEARKELNRMRAKMETLRAPKEVQLALAFRRMELIGIIKEENGLKEGARVPDGVVLDVSSSEYLDCTKKWFEASQHSWVSRETMDVP